MNNLIRKLLEQNTKKQLASATFNHFCTRAALCYSNVTFIGYPVDKAGLRLDGKFYSYEDLRVIYDDIKVQCSIIRKCVRKMKGLVIRFLWFYSEKSRNNG
jgi:hypothetical protein